MIKSRRFYIGAAKIRQIEGKGLRFKEFKGFKGLKGKMGRENI